MSSRKICSYYTYIMLSKKIKKIMKEISVETDENKTLKLIFKLKLLKESNNSFEKVFIDLPPKYNEVVTKIAEIVLDEKWTNFKKKMKGGKEK